MKGFTLIETIVVIIVFTLALGALFALIMMAYRTQSYTWEQSQAIEEARRGVETMVREIREARNGDNGAYIIFVTQDREFGFYSDIDKDFDIERVRYFVEGDPDVPEGALFKKGVINPVGIPATYPTSSEVVTTLAKYVRNGPPIFRYYDENGNELSPPARRKDTTLMEVYLVINVDRNRTPQDFELKSRTQIRNLRFTP
ncbi:MAG TPA: type II secretion system protein [Candidatus Omnitrophica bacterium]|nr:type II secretion system protein [Candidatus Omnitrophota bacterium]